MKWLTVPLLTYFMSCSPHFLRARICKILRSPGIDSKESIPPAYVAWRAGPTTLFVDSLGSLKFYKGAGKIGALKFIYIPFSNIK
jgi:hypothetical protein